MILKGLMGHIGTLYRSIVEKHVSYIFVTLNNYSPDLGKPCDAINFSSWKIHIPAISVCPLYAILWIMLQRHIELDETFMKITWAVLSVSVYQI